MGNKVLIALIAIMLTFAVAIVAFIAVFGDSAARAMARPRQFFKPRPDAGRCLKTRDAL